MPGGLLEAQAPLLLRSHGKAVAAQLRSVRQAEVARDAADEVHPPSVRACRRTNDRMSSACATVRERDQ
jgi:hypothetical protein